MNGGNFEEEGERKTPKAIITTKSSHGRAMYERRSIFVSSMRSTWQQHRAAFVLLSKDPELSVLKSHFPGTHNSGGTRHYKFLIYVCISVARRLLSNSARPQTHASLITLNFSRSDFTLPPIPPFLFSSPPRHLLDKLPYCPHAAAN